MNVSNLKERGIYAASTHFHTAQEMGWGQLRNGDLLRNVKICESRLNFSFSRARDGQLSYTGGSIQIPQRLFAVTQRVRMVRYQL
jgi:hypothetical protein